MSGPNLLGYRHPPLTERLHPQAVKMIAHVMTTDAALAVERLFGEKLRWYMTREAPVSDLSFFTAPYTVWTEVRP